MGMSRVDEGAFVVKLPVDSPGLVLLPFEAAGTAVVCDRVSDTPGVSVVVVRIVVCRVICALLVSGALLVSTSGSAPCVHVWCDVLG